MTCNNKRRAGQAVNGLADRRSPGDAGRMKWLILCLAATLTLHADDGLDGEWSLDLPGSEAGWLAVAPAQVELLWAVGSARPLTGWKREDGVLSFERGLRRPPAAKAQPHQIRLRAEGDRLLGSLQQGSEPAVSFTGRRQPPMPPRPDLGRVVFRAPVTLFNGRDLSGWQPADPAKKNGWSVRDGLLCNDTPKTDFSAYGDHTNLRTMAEFSDFRLRLDYRLPAPDGGNSGVYLRGMYEVQVTHRDSSMQGISGPGAVFGRALPTHNAGRPAGEWDQLEITLVDRHITVVLNGERVVDNAPVPGCTGGALQSDVTRPGPILLQGDHTSVQYRNLVLEPVTGRR